MDSSNLVYASQSIGSEKRFCRRESFWIQAISRTRTLTLILIAQLDCVFSGSWGLGPSRPSRRGLWGELTLGINGWVETHPYESRLPPFLA